MSEFRIWHNPRCSKSRQSLQLLRDRGIEPTVVLYLQSPPDADEIDRVLRALGKEPRELMRSGEPVYKELRLSNPELGRAELIGAMVQNPILIERPVVLRGTRAVVGRPPEAVLRLLERPD
jgi:arsenate reductase (glutaredoxin)